MPLSAPPGRRWVSRRAGCGCQLLRFSDILQRMPLISVHASGARLQLLILALPVPLGSIQPVVAGVGFKLRAASGVDYTLTAYSYNARVCGSDAKFVLSAALPCCLQLAAHQIHICLHGQIMWPISTCSARW